MLSETMLAVSEYVVLFKVGYDAAADALLLDLAGNCRKRDRPIAGRIGTVPLLKHWGDEG